ncbi:MAG: hypothetical protein ACLFVO_25795 [Chloroflexaceae bacterium]
MTTLTIELTPELYAQLQHEAQRQGKAETEIAQEWLAERLTPPMQATEPLTYPELAPDVRALLATMTDADMIVPPQGTPEDTIRLFQSWNEADMADSEDEGEETWEDILRAIDANRTSYRKLFPDLDRQK